MEVARAVNIPSNREILHVELRGFIVDGQEGVNDPLGMSALRLEIETHIVTAPADRGAEPHQVRPPAGVSIHELSSTRSRPRPRPSTDTEKDLGVAVADIGAGTTGLALFLEGSPFHTAILPLGGNNVTNDVAIGLKTSLQVAEDLKIRHGTCNLAASARTRTVSVSVPARRGRTISAPRSARSSTPACARSSSRSASRSSAPAGGMLPAGLVLTGGASQLAGVAELGREVLQMPVRVAAPSGRRRPHRPLLTPAFSTSIGLLRWGFPGHRRGPRPPLRIGSRVRRPGSPAGVGARPLPLAPRCRGAPPHASLLCGGCGSGDGSPLDSGPTPGTRAPVPAYGGSGSRSSRSCPGHAPEETSMPLRSDSENFALIRVVGIGGGGSNAVNRMIRAEMMGVEFIACNTDAQALLQSDAPHKIRIGDKITKGLGAGGDPGIGQRRPRKRPEKIYEALKDSDMVFITAGLGGGTGSGAAPVIAEIARDLGALTIGVVTKPFSFEGAKRRLNCREGRRAAARQGRHAHHDPQRPPQDVVQKNTSIVDAFRVVDDVLRQGVQGISDLITVPGLINLDFADVRAIMKNAGSALMGIGRASGENRAVEAAQQAIASPLLEISITGAQGVLFNVTGGPNLGLFEVNEAAEIIRATTDPEANIIFGTVIDERMGDDVMITVIATGFDASRTSRHGARRLRRSPPACAPARPATSWPPSRASGRTQRRRHARCARPPGPTRRAATEPAERSASRAP